MKITLPARAAEECELHTIDLRRDTRKVVELRAIISDKFGFASGEVLNISSGGLRLRLTKRLRCGQYISLMVYPKDRTSAVQIDLAKVTWVEAERVGVEFLGVSPQTHDLHRLCGDQADRMTTNSSGSSKRQRQAYRL